MAQKILLSLAVLLISTWLSTVSASLSGALIENPDENIADIGDIDLIIPEELDSRMEPQTTLRPSIPWDFCAEQPNGFTEPDPNDCSRYIVCLGGQVTRMECPPGLNFDRDAIVCNWPQFVDCNPREEEEEDDDDDDYDEDSPEDPASEYDEA